MNSKAGDTMSITVFAATVLVLSAAQADTYSTSPSGAWTQSADKIVFDSASDGELTSTTTTQSETTPVGLSGSVSLEKKGAGTLTVNGVHSFSGNIEVKEGTLQTGSGAFDQNNARNSPLGDPRTARTIAVYTNATLSLKSSGVFGNGKRSTTGILADVEIRGGTLQTDNGKGNGLGNLFLHNATLNLGTGASSKWPSLLIDGKLVFSSDNATAYTIQSAGNYSGFMFGRKKPSEVYVPDITGNDDSDVTFQGVIQDVDNSNWDSRTCFVKTGDGTLELANMESTFKRDVVVSNGTLKLTGRDARIGSSVNTVLGMSDALHTIYIEKDATLHFAASDLLGQFYNNATGVAIHVRGGKLKQDDSKANNLGPLVLEDATLEYGRGGYSNGRWPAFGFSDVTFKGKTAYNLSTNGFDVCYLAIGMNGMGSLGVEKIVSNGTYEDIDKPDVTLTAPIKDCEIAWTKNGTTYGPRPSTFRKTGPGILKLNNKESSFSGDVEISDGVVTLLEKGTNYGRGPESGPLGNLMTNKTITVCGSGELYYHKSDMLSQACADMAATMVVSNGTMRFKSGTINGWPTVKFYDPNLIYENGAGNSNMADADYWGLWTFRNPVTFDGTKTLSLPSNGDKCIMSLGYSSDFWKEAPVNNLTNYHGRTEFCVREMTGNSCVDVDIVMDVQSLPSWTGPNNRVTKNVRYRCGLLKTGPGTLRLGGKFTCPEATRIAEGALVFDGTLSEQKAGWGLSAMQVQSGAYLGGTGTVANVTIEAGGGFTSAIGHADALTVGTVTLPEDNVVKINIACTNDFSTLQSYVVPVVKSAGLAGATFVPVLNGGETLPGNLNMNVVVKDGVVYGKLSGKGLVVSFK